MGVKVKTRVRGGRITAAAGLTLAMACGGGGYSTGPSGGGGTSGATITIGTNGAVSPASVTVNVGQAVTFTNNSNRTRNITSDQHPDHQDCPPINNVNLIAGGQTKQTGAFGTARTCGFHDHDDPDNAALKGSIVIR
jgi:plastocyanin